MEDKKDKQMSEYMDSGKNFKDIYIEELERGYVKQENNGGYNCIFCGEHFEEGLIYSSRDRMVTAERAVIEHIEDEHGSSFQSLISLDKQISGLSDVQKNILISMYKRKDVKDIGEDMGISPATVRTHKFNLQKMKREAKIFLALMDIVENENNSSESKKINNNIDSIELLEPAKEDVFSLNSLHPFFTQCRYK
ncbi:MAG: LuxR C-terminal-related transcriptional regulator [Clostridium sp.]|uniref:helix-turn-helix transcriptional regulator n=1 Tax=Clostridium sp. TaxID=1506 RepID=UPI00302755C7